jgi:hypothetical protein
MKAQRRSRGITPLFRHVRKITKSDYELQHVCPSVRLSAWNNAASTGHIFMKFGVFLNLFEKIQGLLKSDTNSGHFTLIPTDILIVSGSVLLRMRNVSDRSCWENRNAHFVSSNFFFFFSKIMVILALKTIWKEIKNFDVKWAFLLDLTLFCEQKKPFTVPFLSMVITSNEVKLPSAVFRIVSMLNGQNNDPIPYDVVCSVWYL